MKRTVVVGKRPVTFSFVALMSVIAGRTLGDLSEDLKILSWLTGENIGTQSVSKNHYILAQERLIAQFQERFKDFHLDSCKVELDKMMKKPCDDEMRNMLIRGWLNHMAARTKMDVEAYYPVKKCRSTKK